MKPANATANNQADFLRRLEREAEFQSRIQSNPVLPTQLDWLTSLIGRYPWQSVLLLSGLTALVWEVV